LVIQTKVSSTSAVCITKNTVAEHSYSSHSYVPEFEAN
jgi:hypothetical protein